MLGFLAAQLPLIHTCLLSLVPDFLPACELPGCSYGFLHQSEAWTGGSTLTLTCCRGPPRLHFFLVSQHLLPGWSPCAQAGPFQNTLQGPQGNSLESSAVINPLCVEPLEPSTLEESSCRVFLISPQIPSSLPRLPSIITIVHSEL